MKKSVLALMAIALFAFNAQAGLFLRYENHDSKKYKFKVKTCGSTEDLTFESSTSGSTNVQTGCDNGVILETSCGEVKIKNNDKVSIKDGCVKIEH
jgi:hypothetical protein